MSVKIIEYVAPESIVCPSQVREKFDPESLAGLVQTIREVGIQQPLLVRRADGKLILTDGARRLRAAKELNLKTVPVIIDDSDLSEADVIQRQLIANCQHDDLTPLEKARAIARLMQEASWSATQVALKLGMSNGSVTRLLALNSLPEAIREGVASGAIPASAGYDLSRIDDPTRQSEFAQQLASGDLTRDGLSRAIKKNRQTSVPKSSALARVTAKLAAQRSVTIAASSLTLEVFIEILEELLGRARQARPKGLTLATFLKVLRDQSNA